MMNRRASMIFAAILTSHQALQVSSLASSQKVSERTIRNDLSAINDMLSSKGLPLLRISQNGQITFLADRGKVAEAVSGDTDLYTYRLSKSERRTIVTLLMLFADPFITIATLAESVEVSRATMLNDLPEIKAFFAEQQLQVDSQSNKGLRVIGPEKEKRLTVMELLSSTVHLLDSDNTYSPYQSIVLSILDRDGNRKTCERILKTVEHQQDHYLSDLSFYKAANYLVLALRRMQSGQFLHTESVVQGKQFQFSKEIMACLSDQFSLEVYNGEVQFLGEFLKGLRYIKGQRNEHQEILKLQTLTTNFISKVSDGLGIDLTDNFTFYNNLIGHLQSTSLRIASQKHDEALQQIIQTQYGDVQSCAKRNIDEIERFIKRNLSENDISYIVLHICAAIERKRSQKVPARVLVACAGGVGTSQLLTERLRRQFSFDIAAVVAVHHIDQHLDDTIDLIIATVPLKNISHPHIVVTPFLNDGDYLKIQKQLETLHRNHDRKKRDSSDSAALMGRISAVLETTIHAPETREAAYDGIYREIRQYFGEFEQDSPWLYELLPVKHIRLDIHGDNRRDVVRLSAEPLLREGYIRPEYVEAMLQNLDENDSYMVISPGFAFPHASLDSGALRTGMSLIRLKRPVAFGHEEFDPVDLVCCLSAVDSQRHLKAFFNLVNMLQTDDFKQKLRLARGPEQAHEIIRTYELMVNQR